MIKNIIPKSYGTNAERAAALLIHYFKLALGEVLFRHAGGDLESEIAEIVQCIINAAIEEAQTQEAL
jgi:hypothetical protein